MVKKAILLFTAAACFTGGSVDAQQAHCFTDEMHAKAKEMYPEKVAAAEAQLKAEIDAALGRLHEEVVGLSLPIGPGRPVARHTAGDQPWMGPRERRRRR